MYHVSSVAFYFRSGKIVSFTLSERPDLFLNLCLFPLLNIKSVRVLNSLIRLSMNIACFRLLL